MLFSIDNIQPTAKQSLLRDATSNIAQGYDKTSFFYTPNLCCFKQMYGNTYLAIRILAPVELVPFCVWEKKENKPPEMCSFLNILTKHIKTAW